MKVILITVLTNEGGIEVLIPVYFERNNEMIDEAFRSKLQGIQA